MGLGFRESGAREAFRQPLSFLGLSNPTTFFWARVLSP